MLGIVQLSIFLHYPLLSKTRSRPQFFPCFPLKGPVSTDTTNYIERNDFYVLNIFFFIILLLIIYQLFYNQQMLKFNCCFFCGPLNSQQSPLNSQQSPLNSQQSPLNTQQSPLSRQEWSRSILMSLYLISFIQYYNIYIIKSKSEK